ncbi:MAG: DUF4469 domain-containing protein [Verrucomicrobia bacterium]|nr:DUF4469 domain-containing protein [Verrucomicrobiota bacterium]
MKPLHWDAINPLTGQPFKWGDLNLRWGNPSYYLEPGDPGFVPYGPAPPPPAPHKPFHRSHKNQPASDGQTSNTQNIMSTFKYHVVPKSGGGFTTRPVLGAEFSDAAIDAAVAAATGVSASQCAAVLNGYFTQFLAQAAGCGWSHDFHGLFSVRPVSGGSATLPDAFNNAAEIKAGVSLSLSPLVLDPWKATLSIQSLGQVGLVTPHVDSIINLHDGSEDTYTAGEIIQLSGDHLAFDKTDTTQGVFYATAAAPGTKVHLASYGPISPTEINAIMPAGVTGALTITVVTKVSGTLRSTTYVHPIT